MKVVVTAQGTDLDSVSSPVFGRCPAFVFVDTETMECEGIDNRSVEAGHGAGVQAAQFVMDKGARAVLTHNVGPNAFSVLSGAGIPIYRLQGGTVRQAVEALRAQQLELLQGPSAAAHWAAAAGRPSP